MGKMSILAIAVGLICGAFKQPASSQSHRHRTAQRGSVIEVEQIGAIDRTKLQSIAAELPGGIAVANGARLLRVTYWTIWKGRAARASGLVALPDGTAAKGVVMYLHGTNATRALAPSQPRRVDGNEETAVFAGSGYVVVLPDYLGLGASTVPQPYLIVQPQVDASIDLLRAVTWVRRANRDIGQDFKIQSKLMMMGFSQGGQVVAGVHRAIERQPLPDYRLAGSVGIAGPYDLLTASRQIATQTRCRPCVGYLTWAAYAYATYYGRPLSAVFWPGYARAVPPLFDGSKTAAEIGAALPEDPAAMFRPAYLAAMRGDGDNWFTAALRRNQTYAWAPVAPFRLYVGDEDHDVPPAASRALFDYARKRGGAVRLFPVQADHQGSAALAYAPTLAWFDTLAKGR